MSGVFQNIDPPPPARRVCPPTAFGAGGGYTRWVERGVGGQHLGRRHADTALYSTYVSTLWVCLWKGQMFPKPCHSVPPLVYKPAY
jgi:hypothetical protein